MKIFVLSCFLLASATAAFLPNAATRRFQRDVADLPASGDVYLPPSNTELAMTNDQAAVAATVAPSAALGDNGYEYRTVRRLKYRYRTQRDVSHLSAAYLPPSKQYLPPTAAPVEDADPVEVVAAKIANEYLPPASEEPAIAEEQAAEPLIDLRSGDGSDSEVVNAEPMPEETAVLAEDGYHYKQPAESAMLKIGSVEPEYLPPLEEGAVEAVGPEESAVLADDGYHYRAIKRFRF